MTDSIWVQVSRLDEIPRLGARVVRHGDLKLAVFRTSSDQVFALADRCPHRGGPLSQGIVHGSCVTCPLHDWVIDLETGSAKGPDEGTVERFPVRIEGDVVLVGIPAAAAARLDADANTSADGIAAANAAADAPEAVACAR